MKEAYEYCLIENEDINELNKEVTKLIRCGWELYGSPGVCYSQRLGLVYFQAIIMTEEIK